MSELIKDKNEFLLNKNYKEYKIHLDIMKKNIIDSEIIKKNVLLHKDILIQHKKNVKNNPDDNDLYEENKKMYLDSRGLFFNSLKEIKENKNNKKVKKLFEEIKAEGTNLVVKDSENSPFAKFINNIAEKTMKISIPNKKVLYIIPIISAAFISQQIIVENNQNNIIKLDKDYNTQIEVVKDILNFESLELNNLAKQENSSVQEINKNLEITIQEENIENLNADKTLEINISENNVSIDDSEVQIDVSITNIQQNFSLNDLKKMSEINKNIERDFVNKNSLTIEDLNIIGRAYGIPDRLLYGVYMKESQGRNDLVSHRAAVGPFQFLKETARDFDLVKTVNGNEVDLRTNPFYAADASARYIRWLFELTTPNADTSSPESFTYALAAYNAGLSRVRTQNGLRVPPFKETRDYVELIVGFSNGSKYIVERGDTLEKIQEKTGVEPELISSLNNGLTSRRLIAGSFINVGENSLFDNSVRNDQSTTANVSVNSNRHLVSTGDTLYRLSRKYNISVDEIMEYNNLEDHGIKIGQELIVAQNDNQSRFRVR